MVSNDEIEKINKGWPTMNIIWAAMLLSLVIYLFMGLFLEDKITIPLEKDALEMLRRALYVVSFVTLVATKYIRTLVLSGKGLNTIGKNYSRSNRDAGPTVLALYTTAMIIALALSESIGIYGLLLFFIGKSRSDLYILILISAAAMLYYRPNKEEIIGLTKELHEPKN